MYLLFIGLFYESLVEFEHDVSHGLMGNTDWSRGIGQRIDNDDAEEFSCSDNKSDNSWEKNLKDLLEVSNYRISTLAAKLRVTPYAVAVAARERKVRVPLSNRIISKYGKGGIDQIRCALQSGTPKTEIQDRYKVGEWIIMLIELDNLDLNAAHKLAAFRKNRELHRCKVKAFIDSDHSASKTDILKSLPGSYDFMLERDREWFDLQFANRARQRKTNIATRAIKEKPDSIVADQVKKIIEGMLSSNEKPKRITRTGVLKSLGYLNQFLSDTDQFKQTNQVLSQFEETQAEFLKRKIKWAISKMCTYGQAISVNRLRRVAGVPASKLYERRQYVIETATALGAAIDGRSFFHE